MLSHFMRFVFALAILAGVSVLAAPLLGAQELFLDFPPSLNVSNNPGQSQVADIALDPGGEVYVVWEDRSVELELFARSTDGGMTFSEPMALTQNNGDYSYGQARVESSQPGEVKVVMTVFDVVYGGAEIAFTRSADAGETFSQPVFVSELDGINSISADVATGWATVIAWNDNNMELGKTAVQYTLSLDDGATFSGPGRLDVSQGQVGCVDVALGDNGTIYAAWIQNDTPYGDEDGWEVFFTRSTDSGATFSAPLNISQYPQKSWCPRMALDASGTIYIVWAEGSYWSDMKPLFSRSLDGGNLFSAPRTLDGPLLSLEPSIAANGNGNVWVSWMTGDPTDRLYGLVTRSTDGGATFSAAASLPGGFEIASNQPEVVHVVWNEVPPGEDRSDIFYSRGSVSTENGAGGTTTLLGSIRDDFFFLETGNYIVDGYGSTDILVLPLFPDVYQFTQTGMSQYIARYLDYTIDINNIEYIQFGTNYPTRRPITEMTSGQIQDKVKKLTDLYLAFFGRAPDVAGLLYWQHMLFEEGRDFARISKDFSWSVEARLLFPQQGLSNADFVTTVYRNCFGRNPDGPGGEYWLDRFNALDTNDPEYLNQRGALVGELLLGAYAETSGPEDRRLLINKHEVAMAYANQLSIHPEEGFDEAINDLLAMVNGDPTTRYNAEHVINLVFGDAATLTDVMKNSTLLGAQWVHDPSYDADDDGDGWSEVQGDCNDSMNMTYPGATEICEDGIDQDCNGVDQSCPEIDGDGDGWLVSQGDCNDADFNIHPGAAEICGDGIDQNCDGVDVACGNCNDAPTLTELAGTWDLSTDYGQAGYDQLYLVLNANGSYTVYDYAGDSFDENGDCYWQESSSLNSLGNGLFRDNEDGSTATIQLCGDYMTISSDGLSETFPRSNFSSFSPICSTGYGD